MSRRAAAAAASRMAVAARLGSRDAPATCKCRRRLASAEAACRRSARSSHSHGGPEQRLVTLNDAIGTAQFDQGARWLPASPHCAACCARCSLPPPQRHRSIDSRSMPLLQAVERALAAQHAAAVQDGDGSAWSGPQLLRLVRCEVRTSMQCLHMKTAALPGCVRPHRRHRCRCCLQAAAAACLEGIVRCLVGTCCASLSSSINKASSHSAESMGSCWLEPPRCAMRPPGSSLTVGKARGGEACPGEGCKVHSLTMTDTAALISLPPEMHASECRPGSG